MYGIQTVNKKTAKNIDTMPKRAQEVLKSKACHINY